MTVLVMVFVVLAALLGVAAGVWVAIGLMTALRSSNGAKTPEDTPPPPDPA